jgi:hypothetical protein
MARVVSWLVTLAALVDAADARAQQPLRQFFTAVLSEPSGYWQPGQTKWNSCLHDNRGWETEEGRAFDLIGADGALCNLSVSQRGGTLDANDGATVRVRRCAGGDVASCTWQDLGLSVRIEPNHGNRDVRWTDSACADVKAGDAIACRWEMDAKSAWEGGALESPELYLEFQSAAAGESFLASNAVHRTTFEPRYCWSIAGGNEWTQTDPAEAQVPLPGAFTLTGWFASFAARPAAATPVTLCKAGDGGAAACGGAGDPIAACSVPAAGPSRCAKTDLQVKLAPGERLFACAPRNDAGKLRATAARFASRENQWFLAASQGGVEGVEISFGRRGANSVQMCNAMVPEDPQCMPQLPRAWTARAIRGWMRAPLSAGKLDVSPRRNGADAEPRCVFAAGKRECAGEGELALGEGDFFNLQATPQGAKGGGAWGVSLLFDSAAP